MAAVRLITQASCCYRKLIDLVLVDPEEDPDDDMAEIEEDNIVGSRTRGKTIDYAKAAENMDEGEDEYDEDEDEDFEEEDNDDPIG